LCHALQKRGKQGCKQHFVIWEWGRLGDNNERRFSKYHYIMMMVTKEPIDQETRGAIKGWIECCLLMPRNKRGNNEIVANLIYFNGYKETEEYADLFQMIESGDFSSLAARDFDASIVTNNRPFVQMATNSSSELVRLTVLAGLGTALLVGIFLLGIGIGSGDRMDFSNSLGLTIGELRDRWHGSKEGKRLDCHVVPCSHVCCCCICA
jgi:hypothetical protein